MYNLEYITIFGGKANCHNHLNNIDLKLVSGYIALWDKENINKMCHLEFYINSSLPEGKSMVTEQSDPEHVWCCLG